MYYPYKVVMEVRDSLGNSCVYEDFGKDIDQSLFVRTAKRVLRDFAGIDSEKFVSKGLEFLPVDKIPEVFKKDFPVNLKSICVYKFMYILP